MYRSGYYISPVTLKLAIYIYKCYRILMINIYKAIYNSSILPANSSWSALSVCALGITSSLGSKDGIGAEEEEAAETFLCTADAGSFSSVLESGTGLF